MRSVPILKEVYASLGCPVEVRFVPGRRGVQKFNNGQVDGEVFRLQLIERNYTRPFVRSASPMFSVTMAVWSHPAPMTVAKKPMGYTLGIVWQEKYVADAGPADKAKLRRFDSGDDLYAAYTRGAIGSFLAETQSVNVAVTSGAVEPPPLRSKVVNTRHLYHYLDKRYAKFMADFSAVLAKRNPFARLQ